MKIIGFYQNGNYKVYIMEDGTKIRSSNSDEFVPNRVESIDMKITDYCDMGCKFCYENSTKHGKHADINNKILDTIPQYTEIAIGGGNPLSHPKLEELLEKLKERKCFANITVNQVHFISEKDKIRKLIDKKLLYGIGVSIANPDNEIAKSINEFPSSVAHVIAGITSVNFLKKMSDVGIKRILMLGYKTTGRGKDCYSLHGNAIQNNIDEIKGNIKGVLDMFDIVSFDNLAIEQLKIRDFLGEEAWNRFYMGDDGDYTMYIDLVDNKYAKNSITQKKFNLLDDVNTMFTNIKKFEEE